MENNKLSAQRDDTPWPGGLPDDVKHINDILAEEGRQLELLLGGKGTLAQCISKEVFGDEDLQLPIRFDYIAFHFVEYINVIDRSDSILKIS